MSVTYEQFLALFPQSPRVKAGKGVRVLCPAHDDVNPSLWVEPPSNGDFTVDFNCLAGCKRAAILEALGLTWADVREDKYMSQHGDRRVTDSFVYELEPGTEYYVIDRQENGAKKKFVARHKSDDKYVFNLDGLAPILYKLPELRQAVGGGRTILLPEGEAKVDRLRELGLDATTNPFGAGKWNDGYTEEFAGADVVILPDNDKTGLDFAEQKAEQLHGTAKRVRILQLTDIEKLKKIIGKDGVDIINWLDAGHNKEELQSLIDSAPEWTPKETTTKSKDTEGEEVKETSFVSIEHCLYEQVVSDGQAAFIEFNCTTYETKTVTHVMRGGVKVIPLSGEEIILGAVKLSSGIAEYGNTTSLLREIDSHVYRYLDVSDTFRKFAAYYVLLSWLYDRFNTLPYLRFIGDTGCGKSRALDVCGGLCYKSISASGCVTPAPIYRMLKRWGGTIMLMRPTFKTATSTTRLLRSSIAASNETALS